MSILVPPAVLLFAGALLGDALRRSHRATARIETSYQVLLTLEEVRERLLQAETAQSAYLVTGQESALRAADGAAATVAARLSDLQQLRRADGTAQDPRLGQLQQLASERFELLSRGIEVRSTVGVGDPELESIARNGMGVVAEIRTLLDAIEAAFRAELAERQAVASARFRWLVAVLVGGFSCGVAASLTTHRYLAGLVAKLERANERLAQQNGLLEAQAVELELQTEELTTQPEGLTKTSSALGSSHAELSEQSSGLETFAARLQASNAELRRVNELLVTRTAEAEEANRSKRDFLAVMSHELRTPLNAIGGYAEIMEMGLNGPVTEAQQAALGRIRRNQEYLLSLITDVLDFAKEESGRVEVRIADVPVADVIRNVQERIEPQVMANRLRYRSQVPDAAVRVRGDRKRIEQILLNLLGNATKFTDPGGEVVLECEVDDERVAIRVSDTGRGISAPMQARIFLPFVQGDGGAEQRGDGAGLGLSISRELARRMGGDLTVDSELGKGSAFTLSLVRGYRAAGSDLFPPRLTIFGSEADAPTRNGVPAFSANFGGPA